MTDMTATLLEMLKKAATLEDDQVGWIQSTDSREILGTAWEDAGYRPIM